MTTTDTEATSSPWCDENDTPIAALLQAAAREAADFPEETDRG